MGTGLLTAIDVARETVSDSIDLQVDGTFALAVSPDGTKIYLTAHSDNALVIVDAGRKAFVKKLAIGRNPRGISFAPDGAQAFISNSFSNEIHIVDTVTDVVIGRYTVGQNPRGIALANPMPSSAPTAIGESVQHTANFALAPIFPNPFNASTQINFSLSTDSAVELLVYNALGQTVRTLLRQYREAGNYQMAWNGKDDLGRDLASGTYMLAMRADGVRQSVKMLLVR
jgi:YVTN family beta-propeller protein